VLGLVGIALVVHLTAGASLNEISRDPLATLEAHPLMGAQSVVGILIWWTAASLALFSWALLRRLGGPTQLGSFLMWGGIITALLALDDQFQFHEDLGKQLFGLRERYAVGALVVVLGLFLLRYRRVIARSEWALLVLAVAFAIGSVAGDFVSQESIAEGLDDPDENLNYLEDTLKLLAIVSWSAYLIRFAHATVLAAARKGPD
jgi:hypothetical protein